MLAYHNDPGIKAKYLARVKAHQEADEITQGIYWETGRGCAVGCTIHGSDHMLYETELGIPVMLALLEDQIFEGLPLPIAKYWPERFLAAIRPGADLSLLGWQFLHWLLTEQIKVEGEGKVYDDVRAAIKQCADVLVPLKDGGEADGFAADAAARAAIYVARAARSAALAVPYAVDAAAYAAYAAAYAAFSTADAAGRAAADAADAATDASTWKQMADKLIALIEAAPGPEAV